MIQNIKTGRAATQSLSMRFFFITILLMILLGIGAYATNVFKAFQPSASSQGIATISQSMLEKTYGLRVSLIAVTAAGGMVDVRLNIVDAEKAKSFLQDKKNFPALLVKGRDTLLTVSDATKSQEIKFEDSGNLFLLFPNSGSAVKQGTSVILVFGDTALEPIDAQ